MLQVKALLLGVDFYKLTAMHYVEDILLKEISDVFAPTEDMVYQKGIIKDVFGKVLGYV